MIHPSLRRRTPRGRALHCCCICHRLEPWGPSWSFYGSLKDEEDCVPLPKFCSKHCQVRGGKDAELVTDEMKLIARALEYREFEPVYYERSYADALYEQSKDREQFP